jgi:hypothetical protein
VKGKREKSFGRSELGKKPQRQRELAGAGRRRTHGGGTCNGGPTGVRTKASPNKVASCFPCFPPSTFKIPNLAATYPTHATDAVSKLHSGKGNPFIIHGGRQPESPVLCPRQLPNSGTYFSPSPTTRGPCFFYTVPRLRHCLTSRSSVLNHHMTTTERSRKPIN